jgi:hypothetical protein
MNDVEFEPVIDNRQEHVDENDFIHVRDLTHPAKIWASKDIRIYPAR